MMNFGQINLRILIVLWTLFFVTVSNAQQKTVKGKITDAETGFAIPGATIIRDGTISGTVSNIYGEYTLTAEEDQKLICSIEGYKPQQIIVKSRNRYNIRMVRIHDPYEELINIGYGSAKIKNITGSSETIKYPDFNRGAITTPQQLISGKVAGLQITNPGGAPGENSVLTLRGGSSLIGNNNPLFLIDGIPLDNDAVSGIRNPLSIIHPSDIESFTVLKDASATALYGSRASNGVIIITTKMAKKDQPLRVNYSAFVSVGELQKSYNVLTADEFRNRVTERYPTYLYALRLLGNSSTSWQDEIYQTAISSDHNLSVTGNQEGVPYRVSYGFTDEKGILKTDKFSRVTMSVGIHPTLFDEHLKVKMNLKVLLSNNRFANRSAIATAARFDPTQAVTNDSPYGGYFTWTDQNGIPVTIAPVNPVAQLIMNDDYTRIVSSLGNINFDYRFHNFPDLSANLNLGYDVTRGAGLIMRTENYPGEFDPVNGGGTFREYDQNRKNNLLDFNLNYSKPFGKNSNHYIEAMVGFTSQSFKRSGTDYEANYAETIYKWDAEYETENSLRSFLSRFNYALKDRYLFSATIRQDRLSYFSHGNRWGTFPSVALAWKINEEGFLKNNKAISILKLRAGYGKTSHQNISFDFNPLVSGQFHPGYLSRDRGHWINVPEIVNPDLNWEVTTSGNIGLDYGFFNNRISGAVDIYQRNTEDLIGIIPLPTGNNLYNIGLTNVGSFENRGVEFSVNLIPVKTGSFTWDIGFNAAYNENKITKISLPDNPDFSHLSLGLISNSEGKTIQIHSAGYPAYSFFVKEQVYQSNGVPIEGLYVDRSGNQFIPGDDRNHYKKAAPDYIMGAFSGIKWKNLDLHISGRMHLGNYIYNNVWAEDAAYSKLFNQAGFLNNLNKNVYKTQFENPQYYSDYYISDASFIKIDNVSMGYVIYKLLGRKTKARLYATLQNVATYTNYRGSDPEVVNGIDYYPYPRTRNMVFGVNIDF
jgi:TonB-dependent starch-binding outer membrane protein SusC